MIHAPQFYAAERWDAEHMKHIYIYRVHVIHYN